MDESIEKILKNIQNKLTLEGKNRVFEEHKEIASNDIKEHQDPEEFTRSFLIDEILFKTLKIELIGRNRKFDTPKGERKVDYAVKYQDKKFLIEAKPINKDLYEKSRDGGVNQIKGVFTLADVKENYNFGIATDGLKWIIINKERLEITVLKLPDDFKKLKEYLTLIKPISERKRHEISDKFYKRYNDILHGTNKFSQEDCFINSISNVDDEEDREEIAQIVINRLIFIKFLYERGFIKSIKKDWDLFNYLKKMETYDLNAKLKDLFFNILNKPKKERGAYFEVDPHLTEIPYLNGSLFEKAEVEIKNSEYIINAKILKQTLNFLDEFKFTYVEELKAEQDVLDPEILGYIFEKAMNARDRKGTGAFYTPKFITEFIAINTSHPVIIQKSKEYLLNEEGYKKEQIKHIKTIDDIAKLPPITLDKILHNVLYEIKICDPAVGSGAFLLAVAQVLFEFILKIDRKLGFKYIGLEPEIKKRIIYNLYGVDINPRAVEIARLRIWLWLVESYEMDFIKPVPNLDCNICIGNSLCGYNNLLQFKNKYIRIDYLDEDKEEFQNLLKKYASKKSEYVHTSGKESKKYKNEFESIQNKILQKLDQNFYQSFKQENIDISKTEFEKLKAFHWGLEFNEIFDNDKPIESRGFDIIIGNPPWGIDFTPYEKEYLGKKFNVSKQNINSFELFLRKSVELLMDGGIVGLLIPRNFIRSIQYSKTRNIFLERFLIKNLADFKKFPEVTQECVSIIASKDNENDLNVKRENLIDIEDNSIPQGFLIDLPNNMFNLNLTTEKFGILKKLLEGKELGKIIDVDRGEEISKKGGVIKCPHCNNWSFASKKIMKECPSCEKEFAVESAVEDCIISKEKIETYNPILIGEDFSRYNIIKKHYINLNVQGIEFKPLEIYKSPKLVMMAVSPSFIVAFDKNEDLIVTKNNYSIRIKDNCDINPKYLMALLNSKLYKFYQENLYTLGADITIFISQEYLKQVAILLPSSFDEEQKTNYKSLIECVDNILLLNNKLNEITEKEIDKREEIANKIVELENKIDNLVYTLHKLNPTEISIIEENEIRTA